MISGWATHFPGSVLKVASVSPFELGAPGCKAGCMQNPGVSGCGIRMGDLLPQIRRFSVHAVVDPVMVGDLAPTAGAALWVKQFFKLLVAKHQHGIGIDH